MVTNRELTEGQRNHLRGLPLYPWAVWTCRLFLGTFAPMLALSVIGRAASLVVPGFLLLVLFALIDWAVNILVINEMRRALHVKGFMNQARLGTAIRQVLYRDALLGGFARK